MKLRIISDLHVDVNHSKWLVKNVRNGVFVSGNHIAYSGRYTIGESQRELERVFPLDEPISYLNDSYKIVDDVVFVGGTLCTDFLLGYKVNYNEGGINKYRLGTKLMAALGMNDYRQTMGEVNHTWDTDLIIEV